MLILHTSVSTSQQKPGFKWRKFLVDKNKDCKKEKKENSRKLRYNANFKTTALLKQSRKKNDD